MEDENDIQIDNDVPTMEEIKRADNIVKKFISIESFEAYKKEVRKVVAKYVKSEGCSCCESSCHDEDKKNMAELLDVEMYDDKSGYDFYRYVEE